MKIEKTNLYKKLSGILRVPFSPQQGKRVMDESTFVQLIKGEVEIEEKLDGSTCLIEFPDLPEHLIFAEDLKFVHSIFYNRVPAASNPSFNWYIVFDIYHKKQQRFLPRKEKEALAASAGFVLSPLLYTGNLPESPEEASRFVAEFARVTSSFGNGLMEGVVIKTTAGSFLANT